MRFNLSQETAFSDLLPKAYHLPGCPPGLHITGTATYPVPGSSHFQQPLECPFKI